MLRQILSISCSLTARRRAHSTLSHASHLISANSDAQVEANLVKEAVAPPGPTPPARQRPYESVGDGRSWRDCLREASSSGDIETTLAILKERCERGNASGTLRAFEQALGNLPPHLGLQVHHLARSKGVPPSVSMAISVIGIYAELSMLRHIESALKEMFEQGLEPYWSVFFNWANVHAEAGLPDGVRAAMAAATAANVELTSHYHTLMVKAMCKGGKASATRTYLQDLIKSGTIPPEPVWRTAIHCQGVTGRADYAQDLFDQMVSLGVEPLMPTWTSLMNAYAECYAPRKAVETMNAMRAAGIQGSARTYVAILKACTRAGDAESAIEAIKQMKRDNVKPTVHVWGALIGAFATVGDSAAARRAFEAMKKSGCAPGVVQYTTLLTAYRISGDLHGGLTVLKEMDADGVKPTRLTFTEIIMFLGQLGMVKEAEEAFEAMQAQGLPPDQISLNVLVSALLTNWVNDGRPQGSRLLYRAEEIFQRGWAAGVTRPPTEVSDDGKMLRVDLHRQGTWSAQLAVLGVLSEVAAAAASGQMPRALMLITGQGLKKGYAPLRESVLQLVNNMGLGARVARGNEGTIIVPFESLVKGIKRSVRRSTPFDVIHWDKELVDPRKLDVRPLSAAP